MEDIAVLKPTFMPIVPRLLSKLYDGIKAKIASLPEEVQAGFNGAVQMKLQALHETGATTHPVIDDKAFATTKTMMGGNMKKLVTGSAPISAEHLDFLKVTLCTQIQEGYGLTETIAPVSVTFFDDGYAGHIGGPMVNNEVKLVDVPDLKYFSSNTPNPQGELCVRGDNVFVGYYKQPELAAEVLQKDGWFHTGDVAEFLPTGAIKIIDRKKHIFKLSQGEYIAPEKLENIYNKSLFVG